MQPDPLRMKMCFLTGTTLYDVNLYLKELGLGESNIANRDFPKPTHFWGVSCILDMT